MVDLDGGHVYQLGQEGLCGGFGGSTWVIHNGGQGACMVGFGWHGYINFED